MADLPRVDLRLAFSYTCDECGKDNFIPAIICEDEPAEDGYWVRTPKKVTCSVCGERYIASNYNEDEEE